MKALLEGLRALGPARLAAMAAVALGMLGMLALMVLRGGTEQMALLYGDLDLRDAGQIVDQLTRQHIPYRVAGNGSQILVPADQVPRGPAAAGEGGPALRRLDRLRDLRSRRRPRRHSSSSRRSTRPARWKASWRAPSAPSTACAARACTWCCRGASRSRASGRTPRPA